MEKAGIVLTASPIEKPVTPSPIASISPEAS
jgi:hypothetical protein